MSTIIKIPTYTYFDNDSRNYQSSVTYVCDSELLVKLKQWNETYGESGIIKEWTGSSLANVPYNVNSFLNAPILSKKSGQHFLPVTTGDSLMPYLSDLLSKLYISYDYQRGMSNAVPTSLWALNNKRIYWESGAATYGRVIAINQYAQISRCELGDYKERSPLDITFDNTLTLNVDIFPDDFFIGNNINPIYQSGGSKATEHCYRVVVEVKATDDDNHAKITRVRIKAQDTLDNWSQKAYKLRDFTLQNSGAEIIDADNPYGEGGSATVGGGDGAYGDIDATDPAEIPALPSISAADLGFITMYNPNAAQLKSLSDFMWSNLFDLATYKKLFSDPMQSVIGLAIVPVQPSVAGSKNVMFGTIDSGISMNYLSTNYVQLDCGSVDVDKYVGCFMDNDPYTKISIYLPFIGIRQLSADDCMGRSLHVVYNIDVLTGACACFIEVSGKGVLYSYNGSCITNVPLTAVNYSGAIQNAVSAIGSAIGIAAGMATGAAPVTAMSIAGLATSAANTAVNSKPTVQRSGNLGGSAGIMSIMTPYVIIERPRMSVPNQVEKFVGQTSNITMYLGDCRGFTMCEYVHLDNLNATSEEIVEIESMLRSGVIF